MDVPVTRYPSGQRPYKSGRENRPLEFVKNNCPIGETYLPVTRTESLYYGLSKQSQAIQRRCCGTFYFYEPESNEHLNLGRTLISANKLDSYLKLTGLTWSSSSSDPDVRKAVGYYENYINDKKFFRRILSNLDDAESLVGVRQRFDKGVRIPTGELYNALFYDEKGDNISLSFGVFDFLDQQLCLLAKNNGFDTLIFQREPGTTRPNTEILDIRDRNVSYASFCRFPTSMPTDSRYPTIWFTDYGFERFPSMGNVDVSITQIIPNSKANITTYQIYITNDFVDIRGLDISVPSTIIDSEEIKRFLNEYLTILGGGYTPTESQNRLDYNTVFNTNDIDIISGYMKTNLLTTNELNSLTLNQNVKVFLNNYRSLLKDPLTSYLPTYKEKGVTNLMVMAARNYLPLIRLRKNEVTEEMLNQKSVLHGKNAREYAADAGYIIDEYLQ